MALLSTLAAGYALRSSFRSMLLGIRSQFSLIQDLINAGCGLHWMMVALSVRPMVQTRDDECSNGRARSPLVIKTFI